MCPVLDPSPFGLARTLVVKLGSAVLTAPDGALDLPVLSGLIDGMAALRAGGRRVIVVTSGAVAAGRQALGIGPAAGKKATIAEKQAMAAVGQCRLMAVYAEMFGLHGVTVGQMLLSRGDMDDRRRYVNARYTLEELLRRGCVPVINENDTVTIDELRFGDNDGLAALVAVKMQADGLVILSDVEGLYDANPKTVKSARLMETVTDPGPELADRLCGAQDLGGAGVGVGSGGMRSKIIAAGLATAAGIAVAIAHGKRAGVLGEVAAGTFRGTYFPAAAAHPKRGDGRRRWMLAGRAAGKRVTIDDGARKALLEAGRSLLPAGVTAVEGDFAHGDLVEIAGPDGTVLGRGVVNYAADELRRIMGRKSAEIAAVLGSKPYDEAIHRDNLALATY